MKTKIILALAMFLIFASLAYADFCDLRGVKYYGYCDIEGDVIVYDEQNNVIAENLYGENSGCYNGMYSIVVSGGPSPGCILQENEVIAFHVSGSLAGAIKWSSTYLSRQFDLSTNRTFIDVEGDDIIVTDEVGTDVSKHGTSGGGSKTLYAVKVTDTGETEITKFNITVDKNKSIEIQAPESGEIYLNLSDAEDSELLVPALKERGTVIVCLDVKSFSDCKEEINIQMGETKKGIYLESTYRIVDGKKHYVLKGLKNGIAKEAPGLLGTFILIILIAIAVFLLVMYLLIKRK